MSERPWYKRFPSDFISGTLGMTLEERGMYNLIIDLMFDRHETLPNDLSWLAGVAGCPRQTATRLARRLIALKKIYITDDGRISNKRAESQMGSNDKEHEKFQENGRKGQEKWQENRRVLEMKAGEINSLAPKEPSAVHIPETRDQISTQSLSEIERPNSRGKRLPKDWRPSEAGIKLAAEHGRDVEQTIADFSDYWLAKPGKEGRKLDWEATWRRWCRPKPQQTKLPMFRSIEGGKTSQSVPADPNDHCGIDAWCQTLPGVKPTTDQESMSKGRWIYGPRGGKIIDSVARKVAVAAGFNKSWRGDWSPLAQWIDAGFSSDHDIIPVVQRLADYFRSNGNPATSLRAFDAEVRKRQAA